MRNVSLVITMSIGLFLTSTGSFNAQRHEDDKRYWKARKEADKERDKYYKERNKERDKYYKEAYKERKEYYKEGHKHGFPRWAEVHRYDSRHHVYFRDYNTFYDPYRRGYVFQDRGRWRFSPDVPSFLVGIDLGRAQIRIIKDIPISRHPEDFYYDYEEDYWD